MTRLFINTPLSLNQTILLSKEHKHYLEKVLRIKASSILVFNNKDGEFLGIYQQGQLVIKEQTRPFLSPPQKALAFGIIKTHRLSWLIEKSCELGITELFPLVTQHVQFESFKKDRYEKITIEAAEQCGRIDLPIIHTPLKIKQFIENLPKNYEWHFGSLQTSNNLETSRNVPHGFIIGPEGGFSKNEEEWLNQSKAQPFSMGKLILRTETAALWCLSQK